jgi:hypothetical protein
MTEECLCDITDCLDEYAVFPAHAFISLIVHHLVSDILLHLKVLCYFNDSASSCTDFLNLRYYEEDFYVTAEHNFFATLNGKSPCSCTGGQ